MDLSPSAENSVAGSGFPPPPQPSAFQQASQHASHPPEPPPAPAADDGTGGKNGVNGGPSASTGKPSARGARVPRRPPKPHYRPTSPGSSATSLPSIHHLGAYMHPPPRSGSPSSLAYPPTRSPNAAPYSYPVPPTAPPRGYAYHQRESEEGKEVQDGESMEEDASDVEDSLDPVVGDQQAQTGDGQRPAGQVKKKRRRQALSCTECKRRKIKCDRKQPCAPCMRRGEGDKCKWHLLEPLDKFVPRQEYDALRAALEHANATNAAAGLPPALPFPPLPHPLSRKRLRTGSGSDEEDERERRHLPPPRLPIPPPPHPSAYPYPPQHPYPPLDRLPPRGEWSVLPPPLPPAPHHQHYHPPHNRAQRYGPPLDPARALVDGFASLDGFSVFPRPEDEYARLVSEVPERGVCDALVDYFFAKVEWNITLIHEPSFRHVYASFWHASRAATPAWLALFSAVLCSAITSMGHVEAIERRLCANVEEWRATGHRYWLMAHRGLAAANFMSSQAIEVVQTLVLFSYCNLSQGNQGPAVHSPLTALAVRIAINMGLSKLGSETEGVVPPPGLLKRELGRRVWWNVVFLDWHLAPSMHDTYLVHPEQFTTAEPANLDFTDLREGAVFKPRPIDERTTASYLLAKVAAVQTVRELIDHTNSTGPPDQAFLVANEKHLNDVVVSRPACMRTFDRDLESANPVVKWERIMFLLGVNNSAIRMHRPYMLRGYRESEYRRSTEVCVSAAQAILVTFEEGRLTNFPGCVWWSNLMHCYTSAVILIVDRFYAVSGVSAKVPGADMTRSQLIWNAIGSLESIAHAGDLAQRAAYVLRFLLQEADRRITSAPSSAHDGASKPSNAEADEDENILPDSAISYLCSTLGATQPSDARNVDSHVTAQIQRPSTAVESSAPYTTPEDLRQWLGGAVKQIPRIKSVKGPSGKSSSSYPSLEAEAQSFWENVLDMQLPSLPGDPSAPPPTAAFEQGDPIPPSPVPSHEATHPAWSYPPQAYWQPTDGWPGHIGHNGPVGHPPAMYDHAWVPQNGGHDTSPDMSGV